MNNLILLLPLFGVYFGVLRPRQKAMKAQQEANRNIAVGDSVMTTSGIYATVTSIDDDVASIEISSGTVIRIDRRAIARPVPKPMKSPDALPAAKPNETPDETPNSEASA